MHGCLSHSFALLNREISRWTLEEKFHIPATACIILYASKYYPGLILFKNCHNFISILEKSVNAGFVPRTAFSLLKLFSAEIWNASITSDFGFVFKENLVRVSQIITWLAWCHRFTKAPLSQMITIITITIITIIFLQHKYKITGDCCGFKFLWCNLGRKHLINKW